jgi:glycosyltransferase involved in cell wall biosynthesis
MARIAFDVHGLSTGGGVRTYITNLLAALVKLDQPHEIIAAAALDRGGLPAEVRLETALRLPVGLWQQVGLPLIAQRVKADVIHATKHAGPRWHGGRSVVTIHDAMYFTHRDAWRPGEGAYWRTLTRWGLHGADAVITLSHSARESLLSCGIGHPGGLHVIYLGVSERFTAGIDAETTETVRRKYGLRSPFVITVGTLGRKKNVGTLIRSLPALHRLAGEAVQLVIVGRTDADESNLRTLCAEQGVSESVVFTGFLPFDDLLALYNCAAAFVFASLHEGFGLPVLEAMRCGLPVVTTTGGGLREVAGDAAVLIDDPLDADDFATKVGHVLTDPGLASALRDRGLAHSADFTWERTARETLAVYESLL